MVNFIILQNKKKVKKFVWTNTNKRIIIGMVRKILWAISAVGRAADS